MYFDVVARTQWSYARSCNTKSLGSFNNERMTEHEKRGKEERIWVSRE